MIWRARAGGRDWKAREVYVLSSQEKKNTIRPFLGGGSWNFFFFFRSEMRIVKRTRFLMDCSDGDEEHAGEEQKRSQGARGVGFRTYDVMRAEQRNI